MAVKLELSLLGTLEMHSSSPVKQLPSTVTAPTGWMWRLLSLPWRLTLIGVGGIGKTRLALQAAGQALDAFAHRVYFVSLARKGTRQSA
jgi:hypothetical protein